MFLVIRICNTKPTTMSDNPAVQVSVLKHFNIVDQPSVGGHYTVKCKYCDSIVKGNLRATSNCLRHIKLKHNAIYCECNSKSTMRSNSNKKYSSSDMRQVAIVDALVDFIVKDLMPLSIVDSASFKKLVDLLDPCFKVQYIIKIYLLRIEHCVNLTVVVPLNQPLRSYMSMYKYEEYHTCILCRHFIYDLK